MRTVALVGLSTTTREAVRNSSADEIWTLNWAHLYDFIPRIDRLFEMHPIWAYMRTSLPEYEKPRKQWRWLQKVHGYPIYMLKGIPEIPDCVRYPLEEVTEDIFGVRLLRGEDPSSFYSSSVDYMLALAIYEKVDVIELYGIEMGSTTEYRYQREGAAFFIGVAIGRGITVKREKNSILLRSKMYGYEGGQMIFRTDLERYLQHWTKTKTEKMAVLQNLEGRLQHMQNILGDDFHNDPDALALAQELSNIRDEVMIAEGACQNLTYLIREVDLEEPEFELVNPFAKVDV